jgi:DNA invertase Pin-like site-specific DNA recombinase
MPRSRATQNASTPFQYASARAVGYYRVSTIRQADHELSLDEQQRKIQDYAKLKDREVVKVFVERGVSGRKEDWPEFQKMLAFAADPANAIRYVIAYNFSRFFRNAAAYMACKQHLAAFGVDLVSATQDIPEGAAGRLMETLLVAFDGHQSEANAATVRDMMLANAAKGYWNGARLPFGYKLVEAEQSGTKTRKRLAIDEDEAETVRLIHRLCLHGHGGGPLGIKKIATHLNERCILRRGKRWATSDVERVLTLEVYCGTAYFNRIDSRTRKVRPRDQWIEVPTPALIPRVEWGAVQEALASRSPRRIAPRLVNSPILLTGLATCGCCQREGEPRAGMMLRTGKGGQYRYLVCASRATKSIFMCDAPTLRMDAADEAVLSALEQQVFTPERLRVLLAEMIAANENDRETVEGEIIRLKAALARTESGLKALYRGAADQGDAFDVTDPIFRQELPSARRSGPR